MSDEEEASYQRLKAEYDALEAEHADELPEEVDARLGEIETAIEALELQAARGLRRAGTASDLRGR